MCTLFKTSICCPNKPKAQIKYEMVMLTKGYIHFNFSRTFFIIRSYIVKKCGKIQATQIKKCGKIQISKRSKSAGKFKFLLIKKFGKIQIPRIKQSAGKFTFQITQNVKKSGRNQTSIDQKVRESSSNQKNAGKFKFL